MLEVMIAIFTITAFLTGTLQLMAFTALYKVRSERQAQANFWIQEDFEDVKFLASTLDVNSSPPNPYITPDVCTNISQGYATALRRELTATLPPTNPLQEQLVGTRSFVRKNYSLSRTFNIINQAANPHRLRIDYRVEVTDQTPKDYPNQENVIARSSVEVIPDASFKCP
ncbi:MAG: type 4 pilin [Microcystis aeruginosa Ma_QC_B_20070730_S2]|uniref:Type 4 pilin n=1 Tax=Microcystis aeruginosa Ma_QC_B_20070730_S2 TaxID=2486256 RepID=A0A552DG81_MICAE|nr:MAG: type 4 pilin [Microcystis aeruginosa Ma_QC_B_20070730_S2]